MNSFRNLLARFATPLWAFASYLVAVASVWAMLRVDRSEDVADSWVRYEQVGRMIVAAAGWLFGMHYSWKWQREIEAEEYREGREGRNPAEHSALAEAFAAAGPEAEKTVSAGQFRLRVTAGGNVFYDGYTYGNAVGVHLR